MNSKQPQDQTQFVLEEPLYEQEEKINLEPADELQVNQTSPVKNNKKLFFGLFLAIGAIILALILGLIYLKNNRQPSPTTTELTAQEQELIDQKIDPFEQRLTEIKKELELVDSTQDELGFPPVDLSIKVIDK
jgi:hypothetical protein